MTHAPGATTVTVAAAGNYQIYYSINITVGLSAQIAIAVNGTVNASTPVAALVSIGEVSGDAILTIAAGSVLTLRNNSAVSITTATAIGSQFTIIRVS
ncbi:BclA C-terminal domain-containing protein [Clostridium sp.]|uniref:BclA C-terminal domain-containing protein n=1 Tax=Clostridium sp. TaxID=1506 RepID=UPI002636D3C0|nr:hypothetical protein [uncultured Clostridium sp.]